MSTSSTTPTSFKGNSTFSSDFSNVISRAVAIASLPIQNLQKTQTSLTDQQSALQGISTKFQSLQTALDSIQSSTGFASFSASSANATVAGTTISSGVMAGSYDVNVTNIGSQSNTMSKASLATVSDPSAATFDSGVSTFTLTVNGKTYSLSNTSGSLNGLTQAVNASGAPVQATIVNLGSASQPDYRLSVQSTNYAPDTIQINDGTNDLLDSLSTGTYVTYKVNGQPATAIQSSTRNFEISPGLVVNALQTGSTTITVSESSTPVSNAISNFTNAYNAVVDSLTAQRGQNGGALAGNSIVFQLQGALRNLSGYIASSGTISSLANIGLTFDQDGHLNFDSATFGSATPSAIATFLGSKTSSGFLQSAADVLSGLTDSTNGLLLQESKSLSSQISSLATQISKKQDQVNLLGQNLTDQMMAADATISALQQQVTQVTNLFTAMQQSQKALNG